MPEEPKFTISVEQVQDFEFRVTFDDEAFPDLTMDEPEPVGGNVGPNASRVLAAAVGNCLSASLLFCLRKSRVEVGGLKTTVSARVTRNERGRMRVGPLDVRIALAGLDDPSKAERCLGLFEDFCVVSASVREGVPISVEVVDESGAKLG